MLGVLSTKVETNEIPIVDKLAHFYEFWDDIVASICNGTISVITMYELQKNNRFDVIETFYQKYHQQTIDTSHLRGIQDKFDHIIQNIMD